MFIDNLLRHVAARKADPARPFPDDFRFANVLFLAPANTFSDFASVLPDALQIVGRFRMFTMTDQAESADWLVSFLYPRSLLYFISGVLEVDASGRSAAAIPLVGLHRAYSGPSDDDAPEIRVIRDFIGADTTRAVWSPVEGGDGLSSGAISHVSFDEDRAVLASIRHVLRAG